MIPAKAAQPARRPLQGIRTMLSQTLLQHLVQLPGGRQRALLMQRMSPMDESSRMTHYRRNRQIKCRSHAQDVHRQCCACDEALCQLV